jgi:hypothetical protein
MISNERLVPANNAQKLDQNMLPSTQTKLRKKNTASASPLYEIDKFTIEMEFYVNGKMCLKIINF